MITPIPYVFLVSLSRCEMNHAAAQERMPQLSANIITEPFQNLELPKNHFLKSQPYIRVIDLRLSQANRSPRIVN
jgi:hypothetical protein